MRLIKERMIYILSSKDDLGKVKEMLEIARDSKYGKNVNLRFSLNESRRSRRITRNYDAYFLHLADICELELIELRKEQPELIIYLLGGSGVLPWDLKDIVDGNFNKIDKTTIMREIIEGRYSR